MSVDCFLKIDGIQGESTDPKHKDEIVVLSWSWGETQPMATAPAGGTGRVLCGRFGFYSLLSLLALFLSADRSAGGIWLGSHSGTTLTGALDGLTVPDLGI